MKRIRRFILLLVSLCLFFNVTFAGALNLGSKSFSHKKSTSLQITNVKKTTILVDYDIETIAEEALQEETDTDNIHFDYVLFKTFDFSIDSIIFGKNIHFKNVKQADLYKLPLFIRYRNFRL